MIGRPKRLLLEAIGRFHYLSAPQLTRLLYSGGSLTYVRDHLKELFHAGYVERLYLRKSDDPHGTPLTVYALDRLGYRYLGLLGKGPKGRFRASEEMEREQLFLRHALAVNDLLVAASLLPRRVPALRIADLRTERVLKRTPVYLEDGDKGGGIAHDAWIDFRRVEQQNEVQICVAFEVDRGTVSRQTLQEKIDRFLRYAGGPYKQAFGTESLTIAYLVVVEDPADRERRLEALLAWTEQVLGDLETAGQADLFRFAAFDPAAHEPEEVFLAPWWYRPFDAGPLPLLDLGDEREAE